MQFHKDLVLSLVYYKTRYPSSLFIKANFNLVVPAGHSYQVQPLPPDASDDYTINVISRANQEYPSARVTGEEILTQIRNDLNISSSNHTDIINEIRAEVSLDSTVGVQIILTDGTDGDAKTGTITQNDTIEIL